MGADFPPPFSNVTNGVADASFIAHRVRSRAWFRLLATPVAIYAAYRLGSLAVTIMPKQPILGLIFLFMAATLLGLGIYGGVFNIIRGSLPATLSIGPKYLSYEEGKHRTWWAWADVRDVHLEHTRGGSRITFKNGSSARRSILPGEWDRPNEVIYRRVKSALLGDFGMDDEANPGSAVAKPHGISLTNMAYIGLATTPFVGVIIAVIALVSNSNNHIREEVRTSGSTANGTITKLEILSTRSGREYLVSYNFSAIDPETSKPRNFVDDEFIACTPFYALWNTKQVTIVFDAKQPHNSRIDFGRRFQRGMPKAEFLQVWRPPFDDPHPGCY